jgi:SecD/SecF fusion protein
MKKILSWKLISILVITLALGFFDLSGETQAKYFPFTPESIQKTKINLGLDLQGGSQLDYKIDLRKVPETDQKSIIEGVQQVIEKRVNRLGVSEPNIYVSEIGGETHIIVELAETASLAQEDVDTYLDESKPVEELTDDEKKLVSLEKAKASVGKTIQLEFKEQKTTIDDNEAAKVREMAQTALTRIQDGGDYAVVGQEEEQAFPGKAKHQKSDYTFASDLPGGIDQAIEGMEAGAVYPELIEIKGNFTIDATTGQAIEDSNLSILKLIDVKDEVKTAKEVDASHILIAYEGAERADITVERSKEEAQELATEIKEKLDGGAVFASLAADFSNDTSNSDEGGDLNSPVTDDGTYAYDFEQATLALSEGGISEAVETPFGFHIIKANAVRENVSEKKYQYETISYSTQPDQWAETGLTGEHFVHADVQLDNYFQPYVSIQFNDEGGDLFEEITAKNVNKPIAIFVGGELVSAPNVNEKIVGGQAQISGRFTNDEAQALARDLNTGAIPAPIVLTGEYTIGASLGQEALNTSINAAIIGLILVMIFMALYYRKPGIVASIALLVYGIILVFLIKSQLHLGIALGIALVVFGVLVTKIVNNQDSGWEKFLSFALSCVGFFFITFLLKTGVVLTLAGIAGIILSIGMAVDANILIFERVKEELKKGKSANTAINIGFDRAWTAIRDSNFSTLLTCAILFYFGSSIIRGFAFNLAAGVLVSMFTAITITRTLLHAFVSKKLSEGSSLKSFGISGRKERTHIKFIKNTKTWFGISGTLVIAAIVSIAVFGLNLGIDFKGGTLLELKFDEEISKEQLASTLIEIEGEINGSSANSVVETEKSSDEPAFEQDRNAILDLTKVQILASGETSYIVKTKYLTSETHDQVIEKMKGMLPSFTEPRFTTIGPVIGQSLLRKAMLAIFFALAMIIIYVTIAFRKIPKEVSPWRFGAVAIAALMHDVIIVTGVFVLLGQFLNVEIDALFITAMLTVFGYSVNDTIVVLDRLRENLIRSSEHNLGKVADQSLNETVARSINTSLSTIITLVSVLIFGSASIFYFVLALTIGAFIGTYSSIFLATPLLVAWNNKANK